MSTLSGRRERVRRGGFIGRAAPVAARGALMSWSAEECTSVTWTVARWLRFWLSTRSSIRPSTLKSYTEHVDNHLAPGPEGAFDYADGGCDASRGAARVYRPSHPPSTGMTTPLT